MGFFENLGKAAKVAGETAVKVASNAKGMLDEHAEEVSRYKEKYQYSSPDELRNRYRRSNTMAEKMAIAAIAKENGWTMND